MLQANDRPVSHEAIELGDLPRHGELHDEVGLQPGFQDEDVEGFMVDLDDEELVMAPGMELGFF